METPGADQVSEILGRVQSWPFPSRIALARRILETLEVHVVGQTEPEPSPELTTRGVPAASVVGLFRLDREPPDDEECRRIVEEERWKKYGLETS